MRLAAILLVGLIAVTAFGQNAPPRQRRQPVQIRVRHADPWAVKTLLEGGQLISPELSTILALMGAPPPVTQGANGLFQDGKFIVNPADNSLWFIPNN